MRKETAELVHPILRHGLRLKERLRKGEKLDRRGEQAELKRLFRLGDGSVPDAPDALLGIRYPLACWLDEIFIVDPDSPWKSEWRDETMEFGLFRKRDRAHLFWEQARQVEARGDVDSLEVFYLCVLLGFRGDLRDQPNVLLDWREAAEARILQARPADWPEKPPELPLPETHVPPLRARERLRWMLLGGAALLGLTILVTAALVVARL
ncbi:MAG TPA: DotU family type IV/VI secretion system protein [Gemmataceae bacterium]|nr:DotU family type IV/VI secretion system protein [Gemmataceae bacterium]